MKLKLTAAVAATLISASALAALTKPDAPFEPVYTLPEGIVKANFLRNITTYDYFEYIVWKADPIDVPSSGGYIDDKVYVGAEAMPKDGFERDSYLVGTVEGDFVSFEFPQPIGVRTEFFKGKTYTDEYYAVVYDVTENVMGSDLYKAATSDVQELRFKLEADGSLTPLDFNKGKALRSCMWETNGEELVMTPRNLMVQDNGFKRQDALLPEIPEGLTRETWNYISDGDGYSVTVDYDDTRIYITGLSNVKAPTAVLCGTIADGKASFKGGQCVGLDRFKGLIYAYACSIEMVYVPGYPYNDGYAAKISPTDNDFVMTLDTERKILTPQTDLVYASTEIYTNPDGESEVATSSFYRKNFIIGRPDPDAEITVPTPIIRSFTLTDGFNFSEFYFTIPRVYGNANLLDSESLYFSLYINGELYPIEPDEYTSFEATADLVKYGYTDNLDFIYFPDEKQQGMAILPEGMDSVGVQAVYVKDDSVYKSDVATYVITKDDAIEAIGTSAAAAPSFDLLGRRVPSSAHGLIISNGKLIRK